MSDLRSSGCFFFNRFQFREGVTVPSVALKIPTSKKSSKKTSWESQKTEEHFICRESCFSNFFRTDDSGCFHSVDAAFVSGVIWWTHDQTSSQSETESHCHLKGNARDVPG
ncbi:hypothetical protein TNCV_478151 [Trichonephila clavipes]|nr:hypothetical protein TNCV_478151 [Trichonephila clavipes]